MPDKTVEAITQTQQNVRQSDMSELIFMFASIVAEKKFLARFSEIYPDFFIKGKELGRLEDIASYTLDDIIRSTRLCMLLYNDLTYDNKPVRTSISWYQERSYYFR